MNIYFIEWNANYEKLMLANLSELGIKEKNNVMKHFTKNNIKLKKLGISNKLFVKIHHFLKLREIKHDDLIICNGFSVLGCLDLIKSIDCKKVLIIRDTIIHLEKGMKENKKWLLPKDDFINTVRDQFDIIYSFDPDDCKKFNLTFLNQFLPYTNKNISDILKDTNSTFSNEKSCFFIGEYREERETYLNEIHDYLNSVNYQSDFYLVDKKKQSKNYPSFCKNESLSYGENVKKVIRSDVIIEINHAGQKGVTLRAIEALVFDKKLITNNVHIMEYDFYNPDRFFILSHDDIKSLPNFLNAKTTPTLDSIANKYSADYMVNTIMADINHLEK